MSYKKDLQKAAKRLQVVGFSRMTVPELEAVLKSIGAKLPQNPATHHQDLSMLKGTSYQCPPAPQMLPSRAHRIQARETAYRIAGLLEGRRGLVYEAKLAQLEAAKSKVADLTSLLDLAIEDLKNEEAPAEATTS